MKNLRKTLGIIAIIAIIGGLGITCEEAANEKTKEDGGDVRAVPGVPAEVAATVVSFSSITINWNSVPRTTGYKIFRSTSSTGTFTEVGTSKTTSYTNTGLTASTAYYYKVAAFNSGGTGEQSSVVSATTNPYIPPEMVWINSETFTMGSPTNEANRGSNETQHDVTISKGFNMGKYEVTQELYQAVMGVNPSIFTSNPATGEVQERRPVESVTWYDAVEFCNKLSEMEGLTKAYKIIGATVTVNWETNGYRLPTEAEWEYACRAGMTTAYNTGDTISDNTGWYTNNSNSRTHEVGKKSANAWGLYDMQGNVWEWCWDWYGSYASESQTDPRGAASGSSRVLRGGGWDNFGQLLRSAFRDYNNPDIRGDNDGFRLLRP